MALEYAHGAIQWNSADAATTVYTVSGLAFQPKALKFYINGQGSAVDAASQTLPIRRSMGFAVSTSARRCVGTMADDATAAGNTAGVARNDAVLTTISGAAATTGLLDLNSITSDGFTLIVDDAVPVNCTVFWEAWGGSDITVAAVGDIAEPAASGNQDYTVTGFVAGATDQVVMLAGCQSSSALNTPEVQDSGMYVGFATGASGENVVLFGGSDAGSATLDTDGYARGDECLALGVIAGGNPNARASLTQFGTDNFRLNWAERGVTNRRSVFLAIKGGRWRAGDYTIAGNSGSATATVSGLTFAPVGLSLIGAMKAEATSDTVSANDRMSWGCGSSTSSRRSMGMLDEDGTADAEVNVCLEYDAVLSFPSTAGALQAAYDINAMNSDGFQIIVDTAGGVASEWQGYLTFGSAPGVLAGTSALAFSCAGALTGAGALAGTVPLAFSPAATLAGAGALAGTAPIAFSLTAFLRGLVDIAGSLSLAFTTAGDLRGAGALAGTSALIFAPVGTMQGAGVLAGSSALTFTPVANLLGLAPIEGALAVAFSTTGAVTGAGSLTGVCPLTVSPTGTMVGAGVLAGSCALLVTPAADLHGLAPIAGSLSLTFATAAELFGAGALAGTSDLVFTVEGEVDQPVLDGAIAGEVTLGFSVSGSITGAGALLGTSSLTFTPAATMQGAGAMSGAAAMTFSLTGTILGAGLLSGTSALVFSPAADLRGSGVLAGISSMAFTPAGVLSGTGILVGTSSIAFTPAGALEGYGHLVGEAALQFQASAQVTAIAEIAGSASMQFTVSGVLTGPALRDFALRRISLTFQGRTVEVDLPSRAITVTDPARTNALDPQGRGVVVVPGNRTIN